MGCYAPFYVTDNDVSVPCGKCELCRARRVNGWAFRLQQEERQSISSMCLTLTYDDKYIPITANGQLSLSKRDVQLFFKRLRKSQGSLQSKRLAFDGKLQGRSVKYYAVGEYGGQFKRPHYHVLAFNAAVELIDPAWNLGMVYYDLSPGEKAWRYCMKYISQPSRIGKGDWDDREPEKALMSKGLGKCYVDNIKNLSWHSDDLLNRSYLNAGDGKKIAMPRYYRDKMYLPEQRELINEAMIIEDEYDGTAEQYRARQEAKKASWRRVQSRLNNML